MTALSPEVEHDVDSIYFGYGSNLWMEQMILRCPTSIHIGVGRLPGFRWLINDRGYANIISSSNVESVVYGLVYRLRPSDERALDRNEGVPVAYTKEIINVEFWASYNNGKPVELDEKPRTEQMLVYIDRTRLVESHPKEEYIHRMNMGITDGLKQGIPKDYFDQILRKFIPANAKKTSEDLARKQALEFEDEHEG